MAAGQGFKTFTTGEVLTAGDVNGYLMQGINVFANATARDAAITAPAEGQFAFTKDNNSLWYYDGAAWVASGATGDIEGVTAGVGISGGGTSGTVTITNSMATAIDAKGDLVAGTGADAFSRLAVGANDTVLTADSTTATGLKWATVAGGGMTTLASGSLTGSSVSLTSISQSYKSLRLVLRACSISGNDQMTLQINTRNSGYSFSTIDSLNGLQNTASGGASIYKLTTANQSAAATNQSFVIDFPDYANTNSFTFFQHVGVYTQSPTNQMQSCSGSGANDQAAAINSIQIKADYGGAFTWDNGTYILYGVN